tara:strand:+ start:1190 stop:2539 length:1350 start_codon:yes stop_codon:yes gene_type:complete
MDLHFVKCAEDAKGIPDRSRFVPLPIITEEATWKLNIQFHEADKAGPHYDLRLNDGSGNAYSWALRSIPTPGQKQLAVEQPTHSKDYMGFSGMIEDGYGKGKVTSQVLEDVEVLESSPGKVLFNRYNGKEVMRYMLKRMGGKQWILFDYTAQAEDKRIPDKKRKYKEIKINEAVTTDKNEVFAPKIDGAHNVFVLKPGKRIDVFSYRKSKNLKTRIDHSYKTDLYKVRSPKALGETVVRGELYIPGQESTTVGGVLNANTWKSREDQKFKGKLDNVIFDIDKFDGKDVTKEPYKKKIGFLKKLEQWIPQLKTPEFAYTQQEKLSLKDKIESGKHPQTDEGLVIYKLDDATPVKAKIKHDYDVMITGVYEAKPGSKYAGNGIGGFVAAPEWNPQVKLQIGSGLNDKIRRDAYQNPNKYIGKWAKVEGAMKYQDSGKIRQPVFKEIRYEKF